MVGSAFSGDPAESWQRARRRYLRRARNPRLSYLGAMQLVVQYARAKGYHRHFYAYALPDFLAISTAHSPDDAFSIPFLTASVDEGGVFELALVAPASPGPVVPFRTHQERLFQELDSCFSTLADLLVAQAQEPAPAASRRRGKTSRS